MINILGSILFAYVLGSIPFGLIIGRIVKGIDVRKHGSGNLGATNVFRVVGKKWGIFVLLLDALKGFVAVRIPQDYWLEPGVSGVLIILAATAILGHAFPVWLAFKGGKGVATSLGVCLAIAPIPTLLTFGLWIVVFSWVRIISIASLIAAASYPLVLFITYRQVAIFRWIFPVSLLLMVFIFYTHRTNIERLIKGEERKLI